jgi:GNAT superfamily N-acetyltransferase
MNFELREPQTEHELALYYDLRWRILREPWTTLRESGRDEHEGDAIHLTAWSGDKLVGTGRLHFNSPEEAQIRCMAVDEAYARNGIGSLILKDLEARAAAAGASRVVLSARDTALPFYAKNGYQRLGHSVTLFDSIEHWWMRKDLS